MKSAYLVLENGKVFKGRAMGATGEVISEIVFTTGMTGYLEVLTDKRYSGQAVVHTFPLIGNYGVISSDFEGDIIGPSAYIVREWCQEPSNFRCEGNLDAFLKEKGIVGICGIDTRALTRIIRDNGTMNCIITQNPDSVDLNAVKAYKTNDDAARYVSVKKAEFYPCDNKKHTVALIDLGCGKSTISQLHSFGCDVHLLPCGTKLDDIKAIGADGVMISQGPGNPESLKDIAVNIKAISESGIPVFAVGLGHQLSAIANGFKIKKLSYGHHGASQPVKNTKNGYVYITNQNHSYIVDKDSVDGKIADITFVNANDGTCEGIEYKNSNTISVQFTPDIGGSPRDTSFVYEKFVNMMEVAHNA